MSDYSYFCGIDLAKNHFSIHAVDQNANVILHKSVTRPKLLTTIENMPLMRIGVEGKTRRGSVASPVQQRLCRRYQRLLQKGKH
ncbi:hypothetical protein EDB60_110164 [Vibrio crassostreae]|nr:hypothetical protein EDB60_110164 [Vibrio crassostreae]